MSRITAVPLYAAVVLFAFTACGRSDEPSNTSSSAGVSVPKVTGSSEAPAESTGETAKPVPVSYEQAESAFAGRDYTEARRLFSLYTERNPENAWGYYMLGLSSWKAGDHEQAINAFDRGLQLDPDHQKSLFNSGRVLIELGRSKEALQRIEQALSREPMSNEGLRLLGRARYQLGQVDEAIDAYHKALAVDSGDVWSMNNLGLIYIDQGRPQEAVPPLARAVELRGNSPVFQNNLGVALERSGYPVAAAQAYEAAIRVDSSYQKAATALARVTGSGQVPESDPIDLAELSQRFQHEITGWVTPVPGTDSTSAPESAAVSASGDSTGIPGALSDSTHSSLETVSDSLEDCEKED
jgi:tetratricopeptide (TPR) repeat protein